MKKTETIIRYALSYGGHVAPALSVSTAVYCGDKNLHWHTADFLECYGTKFLLNRLQEFIAEGAKVFGHLDANPTKGYRAVTIWELRL